ncbi:CapA family protein [Phocaeicola dorei]|jgi:poly-gamma-glutamate synthesis protein (capsule biosynthesis protein)|uniref:CapA family protein n=1 Tax=Phocaeicola dorei TaxID=357276 RepID=UPI003219A5BE
MLDMLITGDFCPIYRNTSKVENLDLTIFGDLLPVIQQSSFAITNLEAPITSSNEKILKVGPNIKTNKNAAVLLKQANFKLVTTANNHILDYGEKGIKDTLSVLESLGISYVGSGKNLHEAGLPFILEQSEMKIGILNFAENEFNSAGYSSYGSNPVNPISNYYAIKRLKEQVNFIIVIAHGGREHYQLPTPKLRERYRFYVDSGADLVVGHHTHCVSGYEKWNGKYIFYSLGNFIFDFKERYRKGIWTIGMALHLKISKSEVDFNLIPFEQGKSECPTLKLITGNNLNEFNKGIENLNRIIINDRLFFDTWERQLKKEKTNYMADLTIQNRYVRAAMARKIIPFLNFHDKGHLLLLSNLLRCEAHNEIMTSVLNDLFRK